MFFVIYGPKKRIGKRHGKSASFIPYVPFAVVDHLFGLSFLQCRKLIFNIDMLETL